MENITKIINDLNLNEEAYEIYGKYKAKLKPYKIKKRTKNPKLVLITATNPTPAGEGKTTTSIGLADALKSLNEDVILALREPSLGPVFGVKGGATGGGKARVEPSDEINLHFNGDFHAITSANNLICAVLDNHIHHGNKLNIDINKIKIKRVLDLNDRQLRQTVTGLGGNINGKPREEGFEITVASELMAIFCLSNDIFDLKEKVSNIILAYDVNNKPIFCKQLNVQGSVCALLKDAINPNLVQTTNKTPCIIHGGPFANIAHGCNSIIATNLCLSLCDITITEAGFGADLGAEKFLNIKTRRINKIPDVVVIVTTVRSLKYNGGQDLKDISKENLTAISKGFLNLQKHIENIKENFGIKTIVAINHFGNESKEELNYVIDKCNKLEIKAVISKVFKEGAKGGQELANAVLQALKDNDENNFKYTYDLKDSIQTKIKKVATKIYGAKEVNFSQKALNEIENIKNIKRDDLPICIAKTQYSLSDNQKLLGRPKDFEITVKDIKLSNGAGFIVCYLGDILTMPGLPKLPSYENIDINKEGQIIGVF